MTAFAADDTQGFVGCVSFFNVDGVRWGSGAMQQVAAEGAEFVSCCVGKRGSSRFQRATGRPWRLIQRVGYNYLFASERVYDETKNRLLFMAHESQFLVRQCAQSWPRQAGARRKARISQ